MSAPIRILIVDDHLIIREGLRLIFDTVPELELVAEAVNGQEALVHVDAHLPDLVLMDLQMPVMDGITAIETLRQTHPELAIVILTTYKEDDLLLRGLKAGARGYLLKDTDRETLINTIQAAARGETLLTPDILNRVLNYQQEETVSKNIVDNPLSEREFEVLEMVADGARNKEIAYKLGISERTVKAHLSHIFQKLNVDSRAGAVATAAKSGIL
ncbi:MAG: response regulator transcription factor [Anaerolineales bacterium]|uniref:Response regulator transcription factor n=1 Tax=Candidatus Desulfolinea nitratireducens TaxID=2841698 RepID=A0A8J6NHI3_9CHLR|nr:response regulator transcription factor [Candidatus Desulfolinea nitratireducens]MBL6960928.1 response regulator transcription factor [Anaerolineales bacterium]